MSNDALEVRYLAGLSAGNMRTTLGQTLAKVANLCRHPRDIDAINAKMVKKKISYMELPENEAWRLGIIKDMMSVLNSDSQLGISVDKACTVLDFACVS